LRVEELVYRRTEKTMASDTVVLTPVSGHQPRYRPSATVSTTVIAFSLSFR
jgi:hypothetical protein